MFNEIAQTKFPREHYLSLFAVHSPVNTLDTNTITAPILIKLIHECPRARALEPLGNFAKGDQMWRITVHLNCDVMLWETLELPWSPPGWSFKWLFTALSHRVWCVHETRMINIRIRAASRRGRVLRRSWLSCTWFCTHKCTCVHSNLDNESQESPPLTSSVFIWSLNTRKYTSRFEVRKKEDCQEAIRRQTTRRERACHRTHESIRTNCFNSCSDLLEM